MKPWIYDVSNSLRDMEVRGFLLLNHLANLCKLEKEVKEIVNFLTINNDATINLLIYGWSNKSVKLIENNIGEVPFLEYFLNYDVLTRVNCIKLNLNADKTVIKLFSGNRNDYELINIFNRNTTWEEEFLKELLASSTHLSIEIDLQIPIGRKKKSKNGKKETEYIPFKNIAFVLFDEQKEWPQLINPVDYQIHLLDTFLDFTIIHFFRNLNSIAERLSKVLNIPYEDSEKVLTLNNFFSLREKEDIENNSRFLSEYNINNFPTIFENLNTKFNKYNLILLITLLKNLFL